MNALAAAARKPSPGDLAVASEVSLTRNFCGSDCRPTNPARVRHRSAAQTPRCHNRLSFMRLSRKWRVLNEELRCETPDS